MAVTKTQSILLRTVPKLSFLEKNRKNEKTKKTEKTKKRKNRKNEKTKKTEKTKKPKKRKKNFLEIFAFLENLRSAFFGKLF